MRLLQIIYPSVRPSVSFNGKLERVGKACHIKAVPSSQFFWVSSSGGKLSAEREGETEEGGEGPKGKGEKISNVRLFGYFFVAGGEGICKGVLSIFIVIYWSFAFVFKNRHMHLQPPTYSVFPYSEPVYLSPNLHCNLLGALNQLNVVGNIPVY